MPPSARWPTCTNKADPYRRSNPLRWAPACNYAFGTDAISTSLERSFLINRSIMGQGLSHSAISKESFAVLTARILSPTASATSTIQPSPGPSQVQLDRGTEPNSQDHRLNRAARRILRQRARLQPQPLAR